MTLFKTNFYKIQKRSISAIGDNAADAQCLGRLLSDGRCSGCLAHGVALGLKKAELEAPVVIEPI